MTIHIKPGLEAILKARVATGEFQSIDEALEAAIMAFADPASQDLSWAKPFLDEADKAIAEGRTHSEEETFFELEQRYGKL